MRLQSLQTGYRLGNDLIHGGGNSQFHVRFLKYAQFHDKNTESM